MTSCECAATSSDTIELRAALSDTLSPRLHLASPGIASGPKWPCPGVSSKVLAVKGLYLRCGPRKHSALFTEPCEMNSMFSAARTSSPKWIWLSDHRSLYAMKPALPPGK